MSEHWEVAGNLHLLAYIRRTCARRPYWLGWSGSSAREFVPPGTYEANVRHLVDAKNAWVADMIDLASHNPAHDGVPVATQRAIWTDLIRHAEEQIRKATDSAAAPRAAADRAAAPND